MAVAQNLANSILRKKLDFRKAWNRIYLHSNDSGRSISVKETARSLVFGLELRLTNARASNDVSMIRAHTTRSTSSKSNPIKFYQLQIDLCGFIYDDKTFNNDRK